MANTDQDNERVSEETLLLKKRLQETEETLQAIQQYMVDAFIVNRSNGVEVVTLTDAEIPYRLIVESMNEGVVTIIPDGTILYCNSCFGQMVMAREEEIIGLQFRDFILPEELSSFDAILDLVDQQSDRGQFCLVTTDGTCVPVQLSIYPLSKNGMNGFAMVATDITLRIQAEEKIRALAAELTVVEQEERHRISQVLHDDLQQRLFAIRTRLVSLKENSGEQAPDKLNQTLDQVQNWLAEAITVTRSLSINISPIVLQGEGLADSLKWLASQMKEQYGLQVGVDTAEDINGLNEQVRVVLFQAVREVLFNVVKHAETLHATVQLAKLDGHGRITVTDSGKGFTPAETLRSPQTAHGLLTVRERLGLIGGAMDVDSRPGEGARVVIRFPIDKFTSREAG